MITVRINFHKTGLACYFSHLDLQRVMARALKKSGLPVWYSLGYNPHIYMTFTLPLSLGHESLCESFDFRLNEEMDEIAILQALKGTLPEGIDLISAGPPTFEPTAINFAKYSVTLFDKAEKIKKALSDYENEPVANVTKTTKKGTKDINLKELIKDITLTEIKDNEVTFTALYPAGMNLNINPNLLLEYLSGKNEVNILDAHIVRLEILDENMCVLR